MVIRRSASILGGLAIVAYGFLFMGVASVGFLLGAQWYGADLWNVVTPWFLTWPEYLIYPSENPELARWLLEVSGLPAALVPFVLFAPIYRKRRHIQGWFMMMRHPPTQPWTRHEPAQSHGNAAFVRDAAGKMRR